MPYIPQARRLEIGEGQSPQTAGELNYVLTIVIQRYLQDKGPGYQTINDIVGALEGAKHEFIRQVVNPYEDKKIQENGPVW